MIQNTTNAAPEADVLVMLGSCRAGQPKYGGGGWPVKIMRVYRALGVTATKKRLKLLEGRGLVRFWGRGPNRHVELSPEGKKAADALPR